MSYTMTMRIPAHLADFGLSPEADRPVAGKTISDAARKDLARALIAAAIEKEVELLSNQEMESLGDGRRVAFDLKNEAHCRVLSARARKIDSSSGAIATCLVFAITKNFPAETQQIFNVIRARACAEDEALLAAKAHRASVFRVICTHTEQFSDWEIVRKTEKAVLVNASGAEFWLPLHRFNMADAGHVQAGLIGHRCKDPYELNQLLETLEALTKSRNDCYVEVTKAGSGPTDKSHKYKFLGKTMTLPVSQILEIDGRWMAPEWLIKEKLKMGKDDKLSQAIWLGWDALRSQIETLAIREKNG